MVYLRTFIRALDMRNGIRDRFAVEHERITFDVDHGIFSAGFDINQSSIGRDPAAFGKTFGNHTRARIASDHDDFGAGILVLASVGKGDSQMIGS